MFRPKRGFAVAEQIHYWYYLIVYMNGIWILLLLIAAAALPVIIVFFWLRAGKSPLTLPWFLVSLAAGIISLLAAALLQNFLGRSAMNGKNGLWPVFFGVFVRIAFIEEASRLLTLVPLLETGKKRLNIDNSLGAAIGLSAGLGFAMFESASYGTVDIGITLLRAFTAAPLHGACGIRAGMAAFVFGRQPLKALRLFLSAVLIHGAYNLLIISPALPSVLAILAAYAALFASLPFIKNPENNES